ncbi:hypothetical protein BJ165DRAFT_1535354 [Panaeolus papilionaceus]|nr:hypothetical protein BJ165DRAFT_1535354 [Panaeolus papilionaceus]
MAPVVDTRLVSLTAPTLDNTIGAALIGFVFMCILFGMTMLQVYWYYLSFPKDSKLHWYSVGTLWVLDSIGLALTVHTMYVYMITGFGDVAGLQHIPISLKIQVNINVIVILMVHSLYAMRVWLLSGYHNSPLKYLVASVVAGGFVIGIVLAYQMYTIETYAELENIAWLVNASLGTATTIDFMIASAMCYYLRKSKGSINKVDRLNSRISIIIQFTLGSGLLTSACSLCAMFSYILVPHTWVFLAFEFVLTKLYVGSFFAMLNARERPADRLASPIVGDSLSCVWQPQFKIQNSSSFWSPGTESLALPSIPITPPSIARIER